MSRKLSLLTLVLSISCIILPCNFVNAEIDVLPPDNTAQDKAIMNENIRQLDARVRSASGLINSNFPVNLATNVTGVLPIANGGTGQTTAPLAINALMPSQGGNSGKFLTTNASTVYWDSVPVNTLYYSMGVQGMPEYDGGVSNSLKWDSRYSSAYGKIKKITGLNTLTNYYHAIGGSSARIRITINGLTADTGYFSAGGGAWQTSTLDISSLTNGTVYDLTISFLEGNGVQFYMDNAIGYGS